MIHSVSCLSRVARGHAHGDESGEERAQCMRVPFINLQDTRDALHSTPRPQPPNQGRAGSLSLSPSGCVWRALAHGHPISFAAMSGAGAPLSSAWSAPSARPSRPGCAERWGGVPRHGVNTHTACSCAWCARGTSAWRRTPPARLATARGSAPPSPAARTPATCAAMGTGGERQPRHWAARYCQYRCARGAAHRGSGRVAPEAARHARMRSARHPAPPAGAPAADRAAALWQLCCRIGTTTTIARAATACKWPRSWSVVRTPEPRRERAMGAAPTRPTGIGSASARARACGV